MVKFSILQLAIWKKPHSYELVGIGIAAEMFIIVVLLLIRKWTANSGGHRVVLCFSS